ncbi:MAG: B12-binding domain-containing radical SAM protein [Candidatus Omnitrophica bacterium]|nr:B12-binding domain-containing radical SAM protein [Candidatus Omnitrophota bacterium]
MSIVLINPNLVVQKSDPLTTGVVYMPVTLAYTAGALRGAGVPFKVIDSYGLAPLKARAVGAFWWFGLSAADILARLPSDPTAFILYAINLTNHLSTVAIARSLKQAFPQVPLVILENPHAVTAYSLNEVKAEFFAAGADFILTGNSERSAVELAHCWSGALPVDSYREIAGLGTREFYNPPRPAYELDALPYPAWELFPLANYWRLRFAHGPLTGRRYLPLLTSRGCPYACRFCVTPAVAERHWLGREAAAVVDEMGHWQKTLGVDEFHIEDLNPTVSEERIRTMCQAIIDRGLKLTWKLVAGTKAETIKSAATVELMARAGCRYVSISPETGSPRVLQAMNKPFDVPHALGLLGWLRAAGIFSQVCFVIGFPGEEDADRELTAALVRTAVRQGADEIALFLATPVPGSAIFKELNGYRSLSELNFSPVWRADYARLNAFRGRLYLRFLWWKFWCRPGALLVQPGRFLARRFATKMEMVPYRAIVLAVAGRWGHFIASLKGEKAL